MQYSVTHAVKSGMTLREQLLERRRQWDEQQPPEERDAARILEDVGAIVSWIPEEERLRDPDPEKRGIQILRAACAVLNRRL
jgi:hypothetical protein